MLAQNSICNYLEHLVLFFTQMPFSPAYLASVPMEPSSMQSINVSKVIIKVCCLMVAKLCSNVFEVEGCMLSSHAIISLLLNNQLTENFNLQTDKNSF